MSVHFENYDFIRQMANILRVKGVRNGPTRLKDDEIVPVWGMNGGGFQGRVTQSGGMTGFGVAGVANFTVPLVGRQSASFQALNPSDNQRGQPLDTRVLGVWLSIDFDAAGSLAFNGKTLNLTLDYMEDPTGAGTIVLPIQDLFPWTTVLTGFLSYVWALSGHRNGHGGAAAIVGPGPLWVPSERALRMRVEVHDGTVFPANTTIDARCMCAQQPTGVQLPM